jgi:zinc protease
MFLTNFLPLLSGALMTILSTCVHGNAPSSPLSTHAFPSPIHHEILQNGLEVFVFKKDLVPVVSVGVFYKVGTADDPADQVGLSHFLEHLMFQGNLKEFKSYMTDRGVNVNAHTSFDFTAYVNKLSNEHLDYLLQSEATRMTNLTFDETEVNNEKKVVLAERLTRMDAHPYGKAIEAILKARFWYHPYGTPPIGYDHHINKYTLESAKAHYEKYYRPDNAMLVIMGDPGPNIMDRIHSYFDPISKPHTPLPVRSWPMEPDHKGLEQTIRFQSDRVATRFMSMSYQAMDGFEKPHKRDLALMVLSHVLSKKTHMYDYFVHQKKSALEVQCGLESERYGPYDFSINIYLNDGANPDSVQKDLKSYLNDFLKMGIKQSELDHFKKTYFSNIEFLNDGFEFVDIVGENLVYGRTLDQLNQSLKDIENLTVDDVMKEARDVLSADPILTLIAGPEAH